jgi:carbonic anhydrase
MAAAPALPSSTLDDLKSGNQRFVEGKPLHALADQARRKDLVTGQHPRAVVLSCSDSRVPPELIFDKGLGELLSVRVAGNVLGAETVASIEDAVEHLGADTVVILGHESCSAVQAALTTPLGRSAGSPDLDALISRIKPNIRGLGRELASQDATFRKPAMQNVDAVGERLLKRSRIIRKRVQEGKLSVVYGIYGLETGRVDFWHTDADGK